MTQEEFTEYLKSHGAREYEVVALLVDQTRAHAAMEVALERGADRPVPYALKMFDDPNWTSQKAKPVLKTNQSVDRKCAHCGGDRFVQVGVGAGLYEETYAPCAHCNASANTERWVNNERRRTAAR